MTFTTHRIVCADCTDWIEIDCNPTINDPTTLALDDGWNQIDTLLYCPNCSTARDPYRDADYHYETRRDALL